MMEFAVASGKGGTGKSTVSSTLLLELHRRGHDVIAVDADAEAPNLHLIFGLDNWEFTEEMEEGRVALIDQEKCTGCGRCAEFCSFDAIRRSGEKYVVNKMICEGCMTCVLVCPSKAITMKSVIRGCVRGGKTKYGFPLVGSQLRPGRPNSGRLVTAVKEKARKIAKKNSVLIVDSAAGIGCQVIASIAGANAVVLVAEPTPAGFSDLKRIHRVAKHFMLPSALIVNKHDLNPEITKQILRYAEEENMFVLGLIPYDDTVPRSMAMRKPHIEAHPNSPAARALREIAERFVSEILGRWEAWSRKYKPRKPEPYTPLIITSETNK